MTPKLSFIIPVRHPDNVKDWHAHKARLAQTVRSVSAQTNPEWNAVVVAQQGADLPPMPDRFSVARVTFPANPHFERTQAQMEAYLKAVRLDKGRRLLAGILHLNPAGHIMLVDDDDFVSKRIVSFVSEHPDSNGWVVASGYGWQDGGKLLYLSSDFYNHCGTSHIVRADLYKLPRRIEDASDEYVSLMLGSHRYIDGYLREQGTPLTELPFPGAIYRIGQSDSHSKSPGVIAKFFYKKALLKQPWLVPGHLARLRLLDAALRAEFFGEG